MISVALQYKTWTAIKYQIKKSLLLQEKEYLLINFNRSQINFEKIIPRCFSLWGCNGIVVDNAVSH